MQTSSLHLELAKNATRHLLQLNKLRASWMTCSRNTEHCSSMGHINLSAHGLLNDLIPLFRRCKDLTYWHSAQGAKVRRVTQY